MTNLVKRLSLPEAIGLSLSVICPTVTAAFNVTLVVQAAGPAAPLAFVIGTVAMVLVALSFMAFTHRVSNAGSAYAYISHTFGSRTGFVAGWCLLLTYLGFATGQAALVGNFTAAALKGLSIDSGPLWIAVGVGAMAVAWWLAFRDMRLAGRLMLGLEAAAVAGIVVLCGSILLQVRPGMSETIAAFQPSANFGGWSGLGFGMVFCILSFGGFEGAATLGEETHDPRRNIPIALLATVLGSGLFFTFVAYCEIVGFGAVGIKELAKSEAPLNDLALRYASPRMAIALDLAAAISCFSGMLGALAAMGRVLYALGRGGLAPSMGEVHEVHGTPAPAVSMSAFLVVLPFVLLAPFVGAGNYYSYASTIGALALILVYISVGAAETVEAWRERRPVWSAVCVLGPALLLWVLFKNVYPVPDFPNNLWPYVALAWVAASWGLMKLRPALVSAM
ncbi:MAG TPA: APC family permease [Steroidobacteraceae bacterium]|nr:APC family permease [Steroidobacteraceae bacterium]